MENETPLLPLPSAPYRGIEPFRFIDQPIFSARIDEVRKLVRLITIYRGIFFYGESGAGKSSLINAGLIPALRDEGFAPERVRVQPFAGQELVLERIALTEEGAPPFLPSRFAAPVRNGGLEQARIVLSIEEFARRIEEQRSPEGDDMAKSSSAPPVLIFDQFEEFITFFEETVASREEFNEARVIQGRIAEMLLRFLSDPALSLKLVFPSGKIIWPKSLAVLPTLHNLASSHFGFPRHQKPHWARSYEGRSRIRPFQPGISSDGFRSPPAMRLSRLSRN
jgi:hypothetical protein